MSNMWHCRLQAGAVLCTSICPPVNGKIADGAGKFCPDAAALAGPRGPFGLSWNHEAARRHVHAVKHQWGTIELTAAPDAAAAAVSVTWR